MACRRGPVQTTREGSAPTPLPLGNGATQQHSSGVFLARECHERFRFGRARTVCLRRFAGADFRDFTLRLAAFPAGLFAGLARLGAALRFAGRFAGRFAARSGSDAASMPRS